MKILPVFILILVFVLGSCSSQREKQSSSVIPLKELESLRNAMDCAEKYAVEARVPIDSIHKLAKSAKTDREASDHYALMTHLMSEINSDTALYYADKAEHHARLSGNDSVLTTAFLVRFYALAEGGVFNLAEKQLEELHPRKMSQSQRSYLWQVARLMYAYESSYTESNYELSQSFREKCNTYVDSLLTVLHPDDKMGLYISAERDMNHGKYSKAKVILDSLISNMKIGDPMYGMVAYQVAQFYKYTEDQNAYAQWLAKAAESDIRTGVRNGLALFNLANWLNERGYVDDAFLYINFAMNEAMLGNARMRAVNIASMLPMIDRRYRESTGREHEMYITLFVISAVAFAIATVFVVMLIIQRRRSRVERKRIAALSQARELHLGTFLSLCSSYYHKLHSLQQLVHRKITSGQTEELLKMVKSGKFAADKSEEIFANFDRSLMEIYPDFIEQINALLRPEERFELSDGETLPAELRIYALVTMGISESQKIAHILNYSVNTVYAYRNKMRNKAIDRENFEKNVEAIEGFKKSKIN